MSSFNEREAARQQLKKQLEMAPKEEGNARFNANWYRKQILTVRSEPLPVLLLPWSAEEPFFSYYKNKFLHKGRVRSSLCTCHDGTLPTACVSCHYAVKWNRPEMLPTPLSAVSVLITRDFHKVLESQGKYKITRYYLCKGGGCNHCKAGAPKEHGLRRYLELTEENKEALLQCLRETERRCSSCQTGTLYSDDYCCPKCGGAFTADGEIADVLSSELQCPHCTEAIYPDLDFVCDACDTPESNTDPFRCIYNVKLDPQVEGRYLFEMVGQQEKQDVKAVAIYKRAPLPFSLFLLTQPLEEQAKALALKNPFNSLDQQGLDDMTAELIIRANHRFVEEY